MTPEEQANQRSISLLEHYLSLVDENSPMTDEEIRVFAGSFLSPLVATVCSSGLYDDPTGMLHGWLNHAIFWWRQQNAPEKEE